MRSFPDTSRSRAAARPQVGVQRGFQAGNGQQVGPGGTGQDVGDGLPVHPGVHGEAVGADIALAHGGGEAAGEGLGDTGAMMLGQGRVGPRAGKDEGARGERARGVSGHAGQCPAPGSAGSAPPESANPLACEWISDLPAGVCSWRSAISRYIGNYTPRPAPRAWERVAPLVRAAVKQADPLLPYTARELLGPLAKLALFADAEGMSAATEVWLSKELIERFVQVGCPAASEATRGNYRSRLLRLREAVIGPDLVTGRPVKLSASAASRPYTSAETAALWAWALAQPTAELRHGCQVLLALGFGCGLDSPEVVPLRAHDVRAAEGGAVAVNVRGRRARLILCRCHWEAVLAKAAREATVPGTASCLFRPRSQARAKNTVTNFLARTAKDPACPPLVQGRARATWLVGLIDEGVRLPVIVAAAGVDTLHALSRIMPFVRPVPTPEAGSQLRGEAP